MFEHYWQIDILPDGKYGAIELVVRIKIVKESETNLRFVTEIVPALDGEEFIFDTVAEARAFVENLRPPYCFTKKAFERYTP